MADSLVDMVMGVVDPDVVTKLAQGVGIDAVKAQNVVNSAIPAMLGGLATTAASPDGASRIAQAVANQDPAVMDNLLSGTGGAGLLSSLLGGAKTDQIAQAVAGANGTSPEVVKSLMGSIAPAVMGVIGQQDPSTWSSGAGIMGMLASQKDAIAAAMPAGMGNLVGMGGAALGGIGAAAGAMRSSASAAMPTNSSSSASNESSGGMPSWLWAVIGLIVLGGLYYYFTRQKGEAPTPAPAAVTEPAKPKAAPAATPVAPAATPVAPAATPAAPAVIPAMPDIAGLTKQATDALGGAKAAVASITDVASATAALPKLTEATANLDKVDGLVSALPDAAKKAIATSVGPSVTSLTDAMDKVAALPGVGDVVKPAMDALKAKLAALSGA